MQYEISKASSSIGYLDVDINTVRLDVWFIQSKYYYYYLVTLMHNPSTCAHACAFLPIYVGSTCSIHFVLILRIKE